MTPEVIDWLLDGDPAIRWQVLRDLVGASPADVVAERSRVEREGCVARLLALEHPNGLWDGGACFPASYSGDEPGQPWTATMHTLQTLQLLDALDLHDVTLVGNDTGGAICQLAIKGDHNRIGGLVLTNCDAFEHFPPTFSCRRSSRRGSGRWSGWACRRPGRGSFGTRRSRSDGCSVDPARRS